MRNIKDLKPNKNGRFNQGFFNPVNKEKYSGDLSSLPIYRSSWEYKFMHFCDMNPNIVKWSSEKIAIPYISPIDIIKENLTPTYKDIKYRNYYVDFIIKVKTPNDTNVTWLVEIKPLKQTKKPENIKGNTTTKKINNYNKDMITYLVNKAKFEAALKYAKSKNMKFGVLTEDKTGNFTIG